MKKLFYFIIILIFGACSVTTEESTSSSSSGTSDGTASAPVELTVGTAKSGGIAYYGYSYYKFTTSSTGAGNYKLAINSMVMTESSSSTSVSTYLYSGSGYNYSTRLDSESCAASCTLYFDYENLDASKTYYLKLSGYGTVTYSLTVSQGGSEGSKNTPIALTLSSAHTSGTIDNIYSYPNYGYSYYKFTTSSSVDNYTLSMNNSDSLDCQLYLDSDFSRYYVNNNDCTAGINLSATFKGGGTGLTASTAYYLRIWGSSTTAKTTTYDNMTVAPEG